MVPIIDMLLLPEVPDDPSDERPLRVPKDQSHADLLVYGEEVEPPAEDPVVRWNR
ncbi:MAG: hypothetical protein ACETVY_05565 [Candidatus Bathyarchaeia archaeon]